MELELDVDATLELEIVEICADATLEVEVEICADATPVRDSLLPPDGAVPPIHTLKVPQASEKFPPPYISPSRPFPPAFTSAQCGRECRSVPLTLFNNQLEGGLAIGTLSTIDIKRRVIPERSNV